MQDPIKTHSFSHWSRISRAIVLIIVPLVALLLSGPLVFSRLGKTISSAAGGGQQRALSALPETDTARFAKSYGNLPLSFQANEGQTNAQVKFLARGQGYSLFLTETEAVFVMKGPSPDHETNGNAAPCPAVFSMKLAGARRSGRIKGIEELPGKVNYFIGNDRERWRTRIPAYGKVVRQQAYPGIDVVYRGNQHQLEYDFLVAPGANPERISLTFKGASEIRTAENGDLLLSTPAGVMRQLKPIAYQELNGQRREIQARYKINEGQVAFALGTYDKSQPLVIDPELIYSTFLGGSQVEQGLAIAVDGQGSAYVTGSTTSTDFPIAGALQSTKGNVDDVFIAKLNPAGTGLIYSTYLGGNGTDIGNSIALDSQGSAYVVGTTGSGSFPTTPGPFQSPQGSVDGFIAKLNPSGSSLVYANFLGGDNNDIAYGVAVDASGRAYVVGRTDSTRFVTGFLARNGTPAYKSTDSAANWSPSAAELTASSVNTFAIDPGNANVIYAGTNAGVFKSTTAGAHWNLAGTVRTSTAPIFTTSIVVDPSNTSIIYAATSGGSGIYRSTDGGGLFDIKNTGLSIPIVNALAIDPNTPTTLYAGTSFGIFKSINSGDSWSEIRNGISGSSPRVSKVVIDPSNPSIVYMGTNRGMFKTTNGGALWIAINSGPLATPFTPSITALSMDPLNPSVLCVAGFNGVEGFFKTTDAGATWSGGSSGLPFTTVNGLAIDSVTTTTVYAATSGTGIFKSTNGGASWSQSNTGLINTIVNAVVVDRNNPATVYAGANIGADAFALRLDTAGTSLEYFLNFGGAESDEARGVAVDSAGNAYITGTTSSSNFPVINALQPIYGGLTDAFVGKLNSSGSGFSYATYLGGSSSEIGRGIAVRGDNAYVVGQTSSQNFPLVNAFKSSLATFDTDAFVGKMNSAGSALDYSSFLGGTGVDGGLGVAVDSTGAAYITGLTASIDFPVVGAPQPGLNGVNDAFITKLSPAGNSISYSTYLGGTAGDQGNGVALDSAGSAYIVGTTSSANFPTAHPFQSTLQSTDAFVSKLGVMADLSISKTESRDPVMVNNPLGYTLKVTNSGPSPVTGVIVTDVLPNGVTFVSATSTLGSCSLNNATVTCNIGNMPVGGLVTIGITVTPTAIGTISNTASVVGNEQDDNSSNNTSTITTKISASPSINGFVRDGSGNGVSGVLMTLTGSQSSTTQTGSSGFYQFAELPSGGNYVITPSKNNLSIDPSSRTFNALSADQSADFVTTTCTYAIAPTIQTFGLGGGSGAINVTSLHDCPWTAVSSADWITITAGSSGSGNGMVTFNVSSTVAPRAGHIAVAGRNVAIYQEFDSCGTPSFSVANYNLSDYPSVVRVADLNGDGRNDIVVANGGGISGGIILKVSVLLNDGNGGFLTSEFESGFGALAPFVLGDFSGDGKPDIAMPGYFNSSIRIFINNGSGGFGQSIVDVPYTSPGQGNFNRRLFTSDLNHDGRGDLLVSTQDTHNVQILLGIAGGGFTQLPAVGLATNFAPIETADVNKDGNPDLILGRCCTAGGSLGVMLGDGAGGFATVIVSPGTDLTQSVAAGDFDGDGNLDFAASAGVIDSSFSVTPAIVIMSGDGAGHFTKKFTFGVQLSELTAADFNNDAKLDVAFTRNDGQVTLLLGDGIGGLGTPIQFSASGSGIVAADFNGDMRPDLAVANSNTGALVLRNQCAGAPVISGRLTDSRNTRGLRGVIVTLSGAQTATTQTDGGGNFFFGNLTAGASYVVTPTKENFRFDPVTVTVNNLSGIQTADFVGTPITLQFTTQDFVVDEFAESIQINVRRLGDLSGVTTVDYATVAGTASPRTDYTAPFGTLRFAAGENLKSFRVLITDDNLVEGWESLGLVLSNPVGAIFNNSFFEGQPNTSLLEIRDNDFAAATTNPLDDAQFFVGQHYFDFLNRVPDSSGFNFWTGQITQCGNDPACLHTKRMDVSNAFFYELEYQQTGAFVFRLYRAAFGNNQPFPNTIPDPNNPGEEKKVPSYGVFAPDRARVVGGSSLAQAQVDLANAFVLRPDFIAKYPASLDGPGFVDAELATLQSDLGVNLTSQRAALITLCNSGGRGAVLYRLADDNVQTNPIDNRSFVDAEYNRAFVATQYFGYLRRNPDMPGFLFWLGQVNGAPLRDVQKQHAMVCSFVTSAEYQRRFSDIVNHSNTECQ